MVTLATEPKVDNLTINIKLLTVLDMVLDLGTSLRTSSAYERLICKTCKRAFCFDGEKKDHICSM
jgi:hypothetical protein